MRVLRAAAPGIDYHEPLTESGSSEPESVWTSGAAAASADHIVLEPGSLDSSDEHFRPSGAAPLVHEVAERCQDKRMCTHSNGSGLQQCTMALPTGIWQDQACPFWPAVMYRKLVTGGTSAILPWWWLQA